MTDWADEKAQELMQAWKDQPIILTDSEMRFAIAQALRAAAEQATQAERERCAKIAEHWRLDADVLFPTVSMATMNVALATIKGIAADIRAEDK